MEALSKVLNQVNGPQMLDETKRQFLIPLNSKQPDSRGRALELYSTKVAEVCPCLVLRWHRVLCSRMPMDSVGIPLEQRDVPWASDQAEHGDTRSLLRMRDFWG